MARVGPELIGRLFDEHGPGLVLYARQWCESPEDVVQDAFLTLARQHTQPQRIIPWLYRVVRNNALSVARSDRRRRRREVKAAVKEPWFSKLDDQLDAHLTTARLRELDTEAREVIIARLWGGLPFEDLAEVLGCSVSAAHRRYQSALDQLSKKLEGSASWTSQKRT